MKNIKKVKKEELAHKIKSKNRIIGIFVIIIILLTYQYITTKWTIEKRNYDQLIECEDFCNQTESEDGSVSKITDGTIGFIKGILETDFSFVTKLLIFLGVVYLIQIGFHIAADIVKLTLIGFVAIFRLGKYIYNKVSHKEDS